MTDSSAHQAEGERKKLKQEIDEMAHRLSKVEHRIEGLDTVLDLRLSNLQERLGHRKDDRDELQDRIKTLEDKISSISVDVAKLLGKWSIITLLMAGFLSLILSNTQWERDVIPDVLPPKAELKTGKPDVPNFGLVW